MAQSTRSKQTKQTENRKGNKKSIVKTIGAIVRFAITPILGLLLIVLIGLVVEFIKDILLSMVITFAIIGVFVWAISFCVTKLLCSGKKRIKDKNGKTIYKDKYELAKEIDALDTQAKNIWEYLK